MGTINYLYDPSQTVWVITEGNGCDSAVVSGTVIQFRANVLSTETTLEYDVRLAGDDGTTVFEEADLFATLSDAVTEYETRLTP